MKKKKAKKNKLKIVLTLSSMTLICICVIYFLDTNKKKNLNSTIEITDTFDIVSNFTVESTQNETANDITENTTIQTTSSEAGTDPIQDKPVYNASSLPTSKLLDVTQINQLPELPTGCEITSLTQVLHFLDYDIDKTDLVDNYLDYRDEIFPGCFMEYFVGSPYDPDACGCFAPALMKTANKYLKSQKSPYAAYDLSYSSINTLFSHVANGEPVIVWTSLDYTNRDIEYQTVQITATESFDWPVNEHCVVLMGYDLDKNTVTFADPLYGIINRSIDDFKYFYEMYYYQAIVIR